MMTRTLLTGTAIATLLAVAPAAAQSQGQQDTQGNRQASMQTVNECFIAAPGSGNVEQRFSRLDRNNDDRISQDEYINCLSDKGVDVSGPRRDAWLIIFDEVDEDGNDAIALAEYETATAGGTGGTRERQQAMQDQQRQGQQGQQQASRQQGQQGQQQQGQQMAAANRPQVTVDPAAPEVDVEQPAPRVTVDQPEPEVQVQQPEPEVTVRTQEPEVTVRQPEPQVTVETQEPEVTVRQPEPEVTVKQAEPQVTVRQPEPQVTVEQPEPQVTVRQPEPEVQVQPAQPEVVVRQPEPEVEVEEARPEVEVAQGRPSVEVEQGEPEVAVEQSQPQVEVESGGEADVSVQRVTQSGQQEGERQQAAGQQQQDRQQQAERQQQRGQQQAQASGEQQRQDQQQQAQPDQQEGDDVEVTTVTGSTEGFEETTRADEPEFEGEREAAEAERETTGGMTVAYDDLIGEDVYNRAGEEIGSIEDIVLDPQTNRPVVVVSVGGFLGIGDSELVFDYDRFNLAGGEVILDTAASEEALEQELEYDEARYQALPNTMRQ